MQTFELHTTQQQRGSDEIKERQTTRTKARTALRALRSVTYFNVHSDRIDGATRTIETWQPNPEGFPWPVMVTFTMTAVEID